MRVNSRSSPKYFYQTLGIYTYKGRQIVGVLLVIALIFLSFMPVGMTANLESRLSRLESESFQLKSRISQLESQIYRLRSAANRANSTLPQREIPSVERFEPEIAVAYPPFDRLATLAIELKERIVLLEEKVAQAEEMVR